MWSTQRQYYNKRFKSAARKKPDRVQAHHIGAMLVPATQLVEGFAGFEEHSVKRCTSLFSIPPFGQAENQPKQLRGSQKNERANEFSQIS